MATMFKNFLANDVATTRTLLHESIPITGTIASGTYIGDGNAEPNIKDYSHGLFQSVYDYPYLSSSANHIFDLTVGYSHSSSLSASANVQNAEKINIYNQMAQILVGHDIEGNIKRFDRDGKESTTDDKMDNLMFINFARLLTKDEIKKGSFKLEFMTGTLPLNSSPSDSGSFHERSANAGPDNAFATLIDCDGYATSDAFTITVPTAAGGSGTGVRIQITSVDATGETSATSEAIGVGVSTTPSAATVAETIVDGINGYWGSGGSYNHAFAGGNDGGAFDAGLAGVTATLVGTTQIKLTADQNGTAGNSITVAATTGDMATAGSLAGAVDGQVLTLQDHGAATSYKINSPAGEYGLLYSASTDAGNGREPYGHIYYQAGIAVVTSSIFKSPNIDRQKEWAHDEAGAQYRGAFGFLPGGNDAITFDSSSIEAVLTGSAISASCGGIRNSLYNIEFNNTTELNSTIYFCRASHNEFNYSSNPTYTESSQIVVKNNVFDQPVAYITSIGLYGADNELLAVAKLSEPIKKTPENELTFRVRLDY